MPRREKTLDLATLRRIAVEADVDPRTVLRELREPGKSVLMSRQRAREALVKRGHLKARDEGSNT